MNDKKWIIAGLLLFTVVVLSPVLWNAFKTPTPPEPVLSAKAKAAGYCVLAKDQMKAGHMQILDVWRDAVVRQGERVYKSTNGKEFNMSLSSGENSCIGCHTSKVEFCDKCHNYTSVRPYCWDCHNAPKEAM